MGTILNGLLVADCVNLFVDGHKFRFRSTLSCKVKDLFGVFFLQVVDELLNVHVRCFNCQSTIRKE